MAFQLQVPRLFAPRPILSPERIEEYDPGQFAPWNFHSQALSLPGLFAHGNKSAMKLVLRGTFNPWNFRSLDVYLFIFTVLNLYSRN